MIYRLMFLVMLMFSILSCQDPRSEREKTRDRILAKFARKMESKGFRMVGSGGGINHEVKKINLISATFKYNGIMMEIESARCLIVESGHILLDLINSDVKNGQFFDLFPAPSNILEIGIIGKYPEDKKTEYIEVVSLLNDSVYYLTDTIRPKKGPYTTVHEESFQKAQAIVNKEGCS